MDIFNRTLCYEINEQREGEQKYPRLCVENKFTIINYRKKLIINYKNMKSY